MRQLVILTVCAVLLAGCSRNAPPLPKGQAKGGAGSVSNVSLPPPPLDPWQQRLARQVSLQNRPVPELAKELYHRDPQLATRAALALGQMGKEGTPHLMEGIRNGNDTTRLICMQCLPRSEVLRNHAEMLRLILPLVQDPNAEIRRAAVNRIGWLGRHARDYVRLLQSIHETDPDGNVRDAAIIAANAIYEDITGKAITGAPDEMDLPPGK